MLRVLIDQDFNHDILRGLLRLIPDLDSVTALSVGLSSAPDSEVLEWAAISGRVLLTHDAKTMPGHAYHRVLAGEKMSGVFIVPRRLPISVVIEDLELLITATTVVEWADKVFRLPL